MERFTNGQVYLTPPKYLNDPWDFRVPYNFTKEYVVKKLAPDLDPEEAGQFYDEVASKADFREEGAGELRTGWSALVGVVCLTEKHFNRLMWAHYGESHKGFVAEFRCDEPNYTKDSEKEFSNCMTPFGEAIKVKYRPKQPYMETDMSNFKECLCTKHELWTNEQEWRIVADLKEADPHPKREGFFVIWFKPTDLVRVIFGLDVCAKVKFQIKQMLYHKEFEHVCKEEAYINPESRELDTRPLSW